MDINNHKTKVLLLRDEIEQLRKDHTLFSDKPEMWWKNITLLMAEIIVDSKQ